MELIACTSWTEVVEAGRNIAITLAAMVGAWIAIRGLRAWRDEHFGKEDYHLARRWYLSALKVREEFKRARSSLITFGEMKVAAVDSGEDPEKFSMLNAGSNYTGAVFQRRMNRVWELLSQLKLETLETEAVWGAKPRDVYNDLDDLARKLNLNMRRYARHETSTRPQTMTAEKLDEIEEVIWEDFIKEGAADNNFEKSIELVMEKFAEVARPYLSKRH